MKSNISIESNKETKSSKLKYYVALHFLLAIYTLSGVCSKMAGHYAFLSFGFVFYYGLIILNLGLYAIVWQQLLKHLNLTTAFCNKAVSIAWGMLWGVLIFSEVISWNMILGAVVVIFGVIIVVKSDE